MEQHNRQREILPCDVDLERAVLGSVLLDGTVMDGLRNTMEVSDFTLNSHRLIWGAMCRVYDERFTVDKVGIGVDLRGRGEDQAVGGMSYLADLSEGIPQYPSLDGYIGKLKEKTTLRRIIAIADNISLRCMSGGERSEEIRLAMLESATTLNTSGAKNGPVSSRELIDQYGIEALLNPKREEGIRLPWKRLNEALCGMRAGQMIVLGAYTGRGKSSFALQCAAHVTKQGKSPYVLTTEMPAIQQFFRMTVQMSGINNDRARHDALTAADRARQAEQAFWLHGHRVWFDERSRTVPAMMAGLRHAMSQSEIGLVIVDHLQHMQGVGRSENRVREVGNNSRALKLAAVELKLPFLVLSQFSRPKDDTEAGLHDFKESGDIENDCDVALVVNGPELDGDNPLPMRIKVAKQREGPAGFEVPLTFNPTTLSFYSSEGDWNDDDNH